MGLKVNELGELISETERDATGKCGQIQDKDVIVLIGCTGSGKTTLSVYCQGTDFDYVDGGKLKERVPMEGFEIGGRRESKTRGLLVAQEPTVDGLVLVDLAGTGDTAGTAPDLCGAIYRSSVLRAARSVRVVLVLGLDRAKLSNERGKGIVRDVEHAAGLFKDVERHSSSVGMVVTSDPSVLVRPAPALTILESMKDAFEDLVESATPAEDMGGEDMPMSGMEITDAGMALLRHLSHHCQRACALADAVKEGDDEAFLAKLVSEHCAVFPVNVLRREQRAALQQYLSSVKPVERPSADMIYRLPAECKGNLTAALDQEVAVARRLLGGKGVAWATDSKLPDALLSLLQLLTVLEARQLLPWAQDVKQELCVLLLEQNKKAVADLLEGAALGNSPKLEGTLEALLAMDAFRKDLSKRIPSLSLPAWSSPRSAMGEGVARAREELCRLLPSGVAGAKWDAGLAARVLGILRAAEGLDGLGSALLAEWAEKLAEQVGSLKATAAECADAAAVVRALSCLEEQRHFLPELAGLLGRHGCEVRSEEGLAAALEEAKAAVRAQLGELSGRMVEEQRLSGSSAHAERLGQLCRSTELNGLLGGGLLEAFVMRPLSSVLVPAQEEIDDLRKLLTQCPPDQWCSYLARLAQRVKEAGELGPQMIKAASLSFDGLLDTIQHEVASAKACVQGTVDQLQSTSKPCAALTAPSMVSGVSGPCEVDYDQPDEHELGEEAERALEKLSMLLPADSLLHFFGRPDAHSALMALQSLGWTLRYALQQLLKKAKKARAAMNLTCAAISDPKALSAIMKLKTCLPLSECISQGLRDLTSPTLDSLRSCLQELNKEAAVFIKEYLQREFDEWAKAQTDKKGWAQTFHRHVQQADRLRFLSPEEVGDAAQTLVQKVTDWRQTCLVKARGAADEDDNWPDFVEHAVRQGMEFEESALFHALDFPSEDFRLLAERQAEKWQREVAAAPESAKPALGQKLRALTAALERLPGFRKDTRTMQLHGDLATPLRQLDAALSDNESRFQRALQEERYPEALQLLGGLQDSRRHYELLRGELGRVTEEVLGLLGGNADDEDVVRAAKRVRGLIQSFDRLRLQDAEVVAQVSGVLQSLKAELAERSAEAAEHLQWALEGRGMPSRALTVLAALLGRSRVATAEEALRTFISAKKQALPEMSCADLATWILQQDTARRSMPEELKSNTLAYDDLIKEFMRCFVRAFKSDAELLQACHERREWGQAKQAAERLRDTIESVLELDILKAERTQLRALKRRLGIGGDGATRAAKEEVKRGCFFLAVRALIMGDGGNAEQELCEAINAELARNMNLNLLQADESSLDKRLSVLEAFLKEVGSHPPDELKSLSREVREVCERLRPRLEKAASDAVEEGLRAASAEEIDLLRLVRALMHFRPFESAIGDARRTELNAALSEFWQRVKRVVGKVAEDIRALEVQSLGLSLEPLRNWLKVFSQLCREEKQLLMEHLQSRQDDLKDWLLEALAKPLEDLLDARAVQGEAEAMIFAAVSRRCKVAERLHAVLQTPRVDLAPLEDRALRHRDAGLAALRACGAAGLGNFNPHYKALRSLGAELSELPAAARHLSELQEALTARVLDVHAQRLREAQGIPDAVKPILELRSAANQAPDAYEDVMSRLRTGLAELQRSPAFNVRNINALGGQLGRSSVGQLVIAEFPDIFGAAKDMQNNAMFRRAGETHDLKEVVGRLTRETGLGGDEYWELVQALESHEELFDKLKTKYLLQGKSIELVMQEAKQDLEAAVASCTHEKPGSGCAVLTHLAACYTVVKCGRDFMEAPAAEQPDRLIAPHRAQMLTIFRLLHAHKTGAVSFWSWLMRRSGSTAKRVPENHLAQVLTGEGKSLTLGLLAAFLALQNIESDVVCYRKILTEQDWQAMLPFYQFVGVEDKVRYVTFDELCSERLESIKEASKQLLQAVHTPQTRPGLCAANRALLIDEVDVFFGRQFYGQTWDGGFKLVTAEAAALVRFIFEEARAGRQVANIVGSEVLDRLLQQSPPEMHDALRGIASVLVQNMDDWSKPEPILDEFGGRIGYKEKDDVNYGMSYSNKTVFAYLNYEMEGKITPKQAAEHTGVDLFCGRFSFAELPTEYCCILGVTGTLYELLKVPGITDILQKEYGIKHITYTPSIFGERRLTFKEAEHVAVLDNEADWLSRIESEIDDQKRAGNAVLVFFKNEDELRKFPGWENLETLTERTDPRRRNGYVAAATTSRRVTLLTRAFGRGIDFQMPDLHQVVVLQTFLSSLVSEESQIKGRTARQGKPGQYRLVLCAQHLEAKMAFQPHEVQALKSGTGDQIRRLLSTKQQAKTRSKVAGLRQRKEKAEQLERETKAWEDLLFEPAVSIQKKLKKLAEWSIAENYRSVHYTVLLDNSGSMYGEKWTELTHAFRRFLQELVRDPATAAATKVSVSLFNSMVHTITPTHAKATEVQDIGHNQVGGGTNFAAAFVEAHRIIGHTPPLFKEMILFLTDGQASVPTKEIEALLVDHGKRIASITCIAFGKYADKKCLTLVGRLFEDKGVKFELKTPGDEAALVQTFVEAASSRAIHFGAGSPS